jgi:hypothetical protein
VVRCTERGRIDRCHLHRHRREPASVVRCAERGRVNRCRRSPRRRESTHGPRSLIALQSHVGVKVDLDRVTEPLGGGAP